MQEAVLDSVAPAAISGGKSWMRTAAAICGVLLGFIFLVSGGWKVLQPFQTGELLEQAQVPGGWGPLGAATLGTLELFAAVLLFWPRYRRWGGILGSALMIFFIGWIAFYYSKLVGHECSCFPIIKRSVGPGFFYSDGVMLLFGLAAAAWSSAVARARIPMMTLAAVAGLAALSFGVGSANRQNVKVPYPVVVDGKPADLRTGKVFLFFYDPSCSHCDAAAKFMSNFAWSETRVVSIPTVNPQWAPDFLHDTKLKAQTSLDAKKLRAAFPFVDPPYGVALVDGQVKGLYPQTQFNAPLPKADLQKLNFIH